MLEAAGKRLFESLGPEDIGSFPWLRKDGSAISREEKQPQSQTGSPHCLPASDTLAGMEAHPVCCLTSMRPPLDGSLVLRWLPPAIFFLQRKHFQFFQTFLVTSIFLPYQLHRRFQGRCPHSGLCRLVLEMALQSNGGHLHISSWPL